MTLQWEISSYNPPPVTIERSKSEREIEGELPEILPFPHSPTYTGNFGALLYWISSLHPIDQWQDVILNHLFLIPLTRLFRYSNKAGGDTRKLSSNLHWIVVPSRISLFSRDSKSRSISNFTADRAIFYGFSRVSAIVCPSPPLFSASSILVQSFHPLLVLFSYRSFPSSPLLTHLSQWIRWVLSFSLLHTREEAATEQRSRTYSFPFIPSRMKMPFPPSSNSLFASLLITSFVCPLFEWSPHTLFD